MSRPEFECRPANLEPQEPLRERLQKRVLGLAGLIAGSAFIFSAGSACDTEDVEITPTLPSSPTETVNEFGFKVDPNLDNTVALETFFNLIVESCGRATFVKQGEFIAGPVPGFPEDTPAEERNAIYVNILDTENKQQIKEKVEGSLWESLGRDRFGDGPWQIRVSYDDVIHPSSAKAISCGDDQ